MGLGEEKLVLRCQFFSEKLPEALIVSFTETLIIIVSFTGFNRLK